MLEDDGVFSLTHNCHADDATFFWVGRAGVMCTRYQKVTLAIFLRCSSLGWAAGAPFGQDTYQSCNPDPTSAQPLFGGTLSRLG